MTTKGMKIVLIAVLMMAFTVSTVKADWEVEQIESIYDDGFITELGTKFFFSPWVSIKEPSLEVDSYFCFRDIDIPDEAYIKNAYLEITAPFPWQFSETVNVTVVGLLAGSMPNFFPAAPDLGSYAESAQFTNADLDTFHSGEVRNITVTSIIQRINDLYTWRSGHEMCLKIYSSYPSENRWAESYDNDPSKSAKLYIEYEEQALNETWYRGVQITNTTGGNIGTAYLLSANATHGAIWTVENDTVVDVNYQLGMTLVGSGEVRVNDGMVLIGDYLYFIWGNATGGYIAKTNDGGATVQIFDKVIITNLYHGYDLKYSPITEILYISMTKSAATNVYLTRWNVTDDSMIQYAETALTTTTSTVFFGSELYFNSSGDYYMLFGGGTDRVCYRQRNLGVWTTQYTDLSAGHTYPWLELDVGRKIIYCAMRGGDRYYLANKTIDDPANSWGDWNTKDGWKIISDNGLFDQGQRMTFDPISDIMVLSGFQTPGWEGIVMTYGKYPFNDFKLTSIAINLTGQARYAYMWRYNSSTGYETYIFGFDQVGDDMYLAHYSWWNGSYSDAQQWAKKIYDNTDHVGFISQTNWYGFESPGGLQALVNGTPLINNCTLLATTIEEMKECIDAYLNGTRPDDPNPPGTGYPPDGFGQLTRFNMRFYIWLIGWVCMSTPWLAMAYKRYPFEMYLHLFILFMVGLGLVWSVGQI